MSVCLSVVVYGDYHVSSSEQSLRSLASRVTLLCIKEPNGLQVAFSLTSLFQSSMNMSGTGTGTGRQVLFALQLLAVLAATAGQQLVQGLDHENMLCANDNTPICARSRGEYLLFKNECDLRKAQRENLIGGPLGKCERPQLDCLDKRLISLPSPSSLLQPMWPCLTVCPIVTSSVMTDFSRFAESA